MTRDKQLRDLFESFVIESLGQLRARLAAGETIAQSAAFERKITWDDTTFGSTGPSMRTDLVVKPLTGSFILSRIDSLKKLPSARRLLEYAENNEAILKHYDAYVSREGKPVRGAALQETISRDLFWTFFRRYVGDPPDFSFNPQRFEREYSQMEDYLNGQFVYTYFAPIALLSFDTNTIELGSGLTIRRMNPDEVNTIFGDDFALQSAPVRDFTTFNHVIECRIEQSKFGELNGRIESVVSALRLFMQSGVGISSIVQEPPQQVWGTMMLSSSSGTMTVNLLGGTCRLSAEEVSQFKAFHERFLDLRELIAKKEYMSLALRRYNSALDERQLEDRIIDFMIALEALYSSDARELRYRLSLRVATFLGKSDREREEILEFMKKAYDARSEIVHGRHLKPFRAKNEVYDLTRTSHQLGEITRLSILDFLHRIARRGEESHETFLDLIDKSLISSSAKEDIRKDGPLV